MNRTKIEWCKNPDGSEGYTWNPITGCLHDCSYCWARGLANGRLKIRMLRNPVMATGAVLPSEMPAHREKQADPFFPRFWEDRLGDRGLFASKPRGIFPCSMGDLFGKGVPTDWTDRVMDQIRIHRQHRFYLLTKQPQNLPTSPSYFPDNCWVGVSATDRDSFNDAIWYLKDVEASVRYISFEPLLADPVVGILDNRRYQWPVMHGSIVENVLDWLIIGAQTKPIVQPKIEWVREIVEAADKAGTPVFFKNSLKPLLFVPERLGYMTLNHREGTPQLSEHLRQEFPKGV